MGESSSKEQCAEAVQANESDTGYLGSKPGHGLVDILDIFSSSLLHC